MLKINKIHQGDCLKIMKSLPDNSIDLIYIDPPFFSGKNYHSKYGSFEDIWEGGMPGYLTWLNARLLEMKRLLKPTGSIYVHLDWHASHYVKCEMDKIFGYENFRNEVVWSYSAGARGKNNWARKHDVILYYTKGDSWTFNWKEIAEPFESGMTEWRYTKGGQKGKPMPPGKVPADVLKIQVLNTMSSERIGYPTQKPEELLNKIILASSNKGDVIADFFCGGGTTAAVAQKLGRRWIASDISKDACKITKNRLRRLGLVSL